MRLAQLAGPAAGADRRAGARPCGPGRDRCRVRSSSQLPGRQHDRPKQIEPVVLVEHEQEVQEHVAGPAAEGLLDHLGLAVAADGAGLRRKTSKSRLRGEDVVDQRVELLEDFVGLLGLLGGVSRASA